MTDTDTPTFWTLVEERASATPHAVLVSDDTGQSLTASAYRDAARHEARRLAASGVDHRDRVSWMLPSTVETAVLIAALARLGVRQNPIIPIYGETETRSIANQVGTTLLLTPETFRGVDFATMGRTVADAGGFRWSTLAGLAEPVDASMSPPPSDATTTSWIFSTSGTTSGPKGVRHSDQTLIRAGRAIGRVGIVAGSRWGGAVPIAHIGVPSILCRALEIGASMHLISVFDPKRTCDELRQERVDVVAGVGAVVAALLDEQRQHSERRFPDLRCLVSGGGPKLPGLAHRTQDELGATLVPSYGMTECPFITAAAPDDPLDALEAGEGGATDRTEIRITGPDDQILTEGEEGEIRVRAPQMFLGYVDAGMDDAAIDDAGFLRTGDLGYLRHDGHLVLTGRLKEVIIRNGENLATREIEDLLLRHPDIADGTVVGLTDDRVGERVCAVVVVRQGASIDLAALRDYCTAGGLMRQKIPEQLEIVEAIPRNTMGKVLKPTLRDRLEPRT